MSAKFDERDIDSYYFGPLTFEESTNLLSNESPGVFLLRDSSRGGYVLCVKEKKDVQHYSVHSRTVGKEMHFFLREESSFPDLPALLTFYKMNLFETTALVSPISKDKVYAVKPNLQGGVTHRKSELLTSTTPSIMTTSRFSAPPGFDIRDCATEESTVESIFARVTKMRNPSPYDIRSLQLSVGDIVKITKRCNSGHWEGESNGKKGVFPFTCVELLDKPPD